MLGIIGAMKEEVSEVLALMTVKDEQEVLNYHFFHGTLAGYDTVVVQGGVGKVNATISTTLLLENYKIDHIINIGSAGGLRLNQEVGDIIIGERVAHHDVDLVGFDYEYGALPGLPVYYEADQRMIKLSKEILNNLALTAHNGLIVSGDQFVHRQDQVDVINSHYPDALCSDMEAASIAQTCTVFKVPFIITRGLSDIFNKGNNMTQFDQYLAKAAKSSAKMCYELAQALLNDE
ncbi:MAG: 5'-methylthioadenosine/adenosylhomocysteine nucleosidase [Erysipelotrichaceae bacterium]|nr:5'-methylthioadenosine/adenosylhomocysteine nucleosidase [Erysipelotrichaceae bacterium]